MVELLCMLETGGWIEKDQSSCGLKSSVLRGSDCNLPKISSWNIWWQMSEQLFSMGFLLWPRWDPMQCPFILSVFCFWSKMSLESGESLELEEVSGASGNSTFPWVSIVYLLTRMFYQDEFSFSSEFRSNLKRFWIGILFSIGKGEKA